MKLHTSMTSPFGYKCRMAVVALGLENRVEVVEADTKSEALRNINPLSKVPALELDDGRVVINSPIIAAYLADQAGPSDLYPADEAAKWNVLYMEALADGMVDAGVLVFYEGLRPDGEKSPAWIEKQQGKIKTGLGVFEAQAKDFGDMPHIGLIALAAGLAWFDRRDIVGNWHGDHPNLSAWLHRFKKHEFWID